MHLNDKKFIFIPENEKLFIKYACVDGIICNRKDYENNYETIKTINSYCNIQKELQLIFLDEL